MKRIILALSLLIVSLPLTAQMNELGAFVSTSQFDDGEIQDAGDILDVEFDEEMGIGVVFNRFWTNGFSTEFAYQRLGADLTLSAGDIAEDVAELDLDMLSGTGQLHFARTAGRCSRCGPISADACRRRWTWATSATRSSSSGASQTGSDASCMRANWAANPISARALAPCICTAPRA